MKHSITNIINWEWKLACREAGLVAVGKWIVYDFLKQLYRCVRQRKNLFHTKILFGAIAPKDNGRIRVLLASQDCSVISGAFRSCAAMAKLLRDVYGYDVILVLAYSGDGEQELKDCAIPYVIIPSIWWLVDANMQGRKTYRDLATYFSINHRAVREWRRLIQYSRPDIIHLNSMSCYVGGLAAISMGVPLIWHMRDLLEEDHGFKIYNREAGLRLISKANKLIAVSECVKEKYSSVFGSDKIVRVYNGVDTKRFYCPKKKILDKEIVTLVFLGYFQLTKGHVEFAKACAELRQRGHTNFEVWYVGGGPETIRKQCEDEFVRVGMQDRVTFWGRQACPEKYLQEADVAFMCAQCEAFGRVTVEMMLTGCLVIGSNTGGTVEIIKDGVTGILFDRANIVLSLADAMENAISDVERSRRLAAAGRKFANENFTAEKNAEGVNAVYRSVLNINRDQAIDVAKGEFVAV